LSDEHWDAEPGAGANRAKPLGLALGFLVCSHQFSGRSAESFGIVSTAIANIHFQGARIVRVIEDVDRRSLTFEMSYPLTERDSNFPRGKLIFGFCSRYLFEEGHTRRRARDLES
jgi:hypothetical protein